MIYFCISAGPVKSTDPDRAAANRAAKRKELARLACEDIGSLMENITDAEAEYEAWNQHWKDSGVPLEPFNLRRERETGYFDEEGNYVAYREEADDAWLATLPEGEHLSSTNNIMQCA